MERIWQIAPFDQHAVSNICNALNVPALLAQVLVARGCQSREEGLPFLNKKLTDLIDPETLSGNSDAADRIVSSIKAGRQITIYGDYDVDGVTATSLLWRCFKMLGANVDYYIPCRTEEGYGLNQEAISKLHAADPNRLIVTVDCGITSCAEADHARSLGVELIITDHHTFGETLPQAAALVHPRIGNQYPFGDLCGVGVAFKLAWAVCARFGDGKRASPTMRDFLLEAIGLTAIGTVADVVPLHGENRVLVHYGLGSLLERSTPGLRHLLQVSKLGDSKRLQAEDLAFSVGPRINAAGRMGQARLAVELLTTTNEQRAIQLAAYLDELNRQRQTVERKIFKQAREMVDAHPQWQDHPTLVLAHPEWHAGVIGIVASRVAERFQRPTVLLAFGGPNGLAQGSGRSYGDFDLHGCLTGCREWLASFGGHRVAAGMKIKPDSIDGFRDAFAAYAQTQIQPETLRNPLKIDAEVRLRDVHPKSVRALEDLGPFGAGNPRPIFITGPCYLAEPPRKMGEGERHLAISVRQEQSVMRAIAFGKGEWADELAGHEGPIDLCFQPKLNEYRGFVRAELQLLDWRPSAAHVPIATTAGGPR